MMKSKVILITGASRGIGRCIAEVLAQQGHRVYATMRNPKEAASFSSKNIYTMALDVIDLSSIDQAVEAIVKKEGTIDVLINNAGYGLLGPVDLVDDDEVQQQFDVNVFGVIRTVRAVTPLMRKQKSGQIINISSVAGFVSSPLFGVYSATKHALEAISVSLAATLSPWNIPVSVVEPGATATEFAEVMAEAKGIAKPGHPYQKYCLDCEENVRERLQEGQDPLEVAQLVGEIIKAEHPHFRYQTSIRLEEMARQFLVDVNGDRWLDEQKKSLAPFFEDVL